MFDETDKVLNEGAQSMQQIQMVKGSLQGVLEQSDGQQEGDSEILLNVPNETMAGQTGVQGTRASRDHRRPRQQKPLSAKATNIGKDS